MATIQNLVIDQGTTFEVTFTVHKPDGTPEDLTEAVATAQARRSAASKKSFDFTVEILDPPTNGEIKLSMTDEETLALPHARYLYDLHVKKSTGEAIRVVEGILTVTAAISR
jgi:hypothetical protein